MTRQYLGLVKQHVIAAVFAMLGVGCAVTETKEEFGHWAFKPVTKPTVPKGQNADWPRVDIDRFLLSRLEAAGLSPSPRTDRRTLLRRVYFDLIGLPPTFAEVQTFVADDSPDAFAKVVDRLLASPRYGERWGRHWLDVARYADTKDLVLAFGADRIRPYAYTYRDYVIRAFNAGTPYDQLIREQLAADLIEPPVERWRLAGMGFLTLGRMFCNNPPDQIDDQIDTMTRGLLGLTVSCARCHDHKYDPIPIADYYSLYGIFAASEKPLERPLLVEPKTITGNDAFEKAAAPKREALRKHIDTQRAEILKVARGKVADYLIDIATQPADQLEDAVFFRSLSPGDLRVQFLNNWRRLLRQHASPNNAIFGPWHQAMALGENEFATSATKLNEQWVTNSKLNSHLRTALAKARPANRKALAEVYGTALLEAYKGHETKPPTTEAKRSLWALMAGPGAPFRIHRPHTYLFMTRVPRDNYHKMEKEIDKLAVGNAAAPPRAMSLVDLPEPPAQRVFVRGNPMRLGDAAPRQFLQVLTGSKRRKFTKGSGRLELATAIATPNNPLTARVIVNRVWMHHFGEPLVATPADFGTRSNPPTHPALLDYLAWTFVHEDGWSFKKLHRRILLSAAWQQSSTNRPECFLVDRDNRLLWRANRRRLEFEPMRDGMLAVAGRLDKTMNGLPVNLTDANNRRRSVYGLVDRQELPGLYRNFDFASPDQTVGRRPLTSTPQQALFGLNAPFVIAQAKALAAAHSNVSTLYQAILQRNPTSAEASRASAFLKHATPDAGLSPRQQLAQVLLLTNEFLFVD